MKEIADFDTFFEIKRPSLVRIGIIVYALEKEENKKRKMPV